MKKNSDAEALALRQAQPYTIDHMAAAQADVAAAEDRVACSRNNNPNRGRAGLRHALLRLDTIVSDLQARGIIPTPEPTEPQRLNQTLDLLFPNAQSRDEVEHEGRRYRLRFAPARMSNSRKTVMEWSRWWEEVK